MRDLEPAIEEVLPERALDALGAALITTDAGNRITSWPEAAERIFGFSADEALGVRAEELPIVTAELAARTRQALSSAPRSWLEHDLPLLRKDGSSFPARVRLALIHGPDGRTGGSIGMVTDTSSPRASRVELASPSSHAPLAALGRLAITGIERDELLAHTAATIRDCLGVELVAMLRADAETGQSWIEAGTGWEPGERGERFEPSEPHLAALTAGRMPLVEVELVDAEGPGDGLLARHGVSSGVSVSFGSPESPAALAVFSRRRRRFGPRDIDFLQAVAGVLTAAEDRARARELERRFDRLSRMEAIGQLTGGIAHDFNNLLSVILNYASFAREEADGGAGIDATDSLREIESAARRAAELTHQMLVFSRQELVEKRAISVAAEIESLRDELTRTLGDRVELTLTIEDGLPAVEAGPGQLEQILINLAHNARDAMASGGRLVIRASVAGAGEGEPVWVRLEVIDDGEGMSREVIEKAFDPFFTTKAPGRGTGLGLATAYGLVSSLGGSIELRSRPAEGTTVDVLLPASELSVERVEEPREASAPAAAPPSTAEPGTPEGAGRLLLVEDDPLVRRLAVRVLEGGGYEVSAAADPREALEIARAAGRLDLVLSDVSMPGMSGAELASELRSERPGLRIVFMSGYTGETVPREVVTDVNAAFVEKPFTPETLLSGIARALRASEP